MADTSDVMRFGARRAGLPARLGVSSGCTHYRRCSTRSRSSRACCAPAAATCRRRRSRAPTSPGSPAPSRRRRSRCRRPTRRSRCRHGRSSISSARHRRTGLPAPPQLSPITFAPSRRAVLFATNRPSPWSSSAWTTRYPLALRASRADHVDVERGLDRPVVVRGAACCGRGDGCAGLVERSSSTRSRSCTPTAPSCCDTSRGRSRGSRSRTRRRSPTVAPGSMLRVDRVRRHEIGWAEPRGRVGLHRVAHAVGDDPSITMLGSAITAAEHSAVADGRALSPRRIITITVDTLFRTHRQRAQRRTVRTSTSGSWWASQFSRRMPHGACAWRAARASNSLRSARSASRERLFSYEFAGRSRFRQLKSEGVN